MSTDPRRNGIGSSHPADAGVRQRFDGDNLVALRSTVAAHGDTLGLSGDRVGDLVLISHELATNAVRHGGGRGELRMWSDGGVVFCEIRDQGPGMAAAVAVDGHRRPDLAATGGRGLWLVRHLSDDVDIRTGPTGTSVTVSVTVDR